MDYGYARVSTKEQNEQRQIVALQSMAKCRGLSPPPKAAVSAAFILSNSGNKSNIPQGKTSTICPSRRYVTACQFRRNLRRKGW